MALAGRELILAVTGQHRRLQGGLPPARASARGGGRHRRDDRPRARVRGAAHLPDALRPARPDGPVRPAGARGRGARGARRARRPAPRRPGHGAAPWPARRSGSPTTSWARSSSRCAGPVLFAPAMDGGMWEHPAVQAPRRDAPRPRGHRAGARRGRARVRPPRPGTVSRGRGHRRGGRRVSCRPRRDLAGDHVLVTAGPTREPLDPVRYLTNRSSGRMGYADRRRRPRAGAPR